MPRRQAGPHICLLIAAPPSLATSWYWAWTISKAPYLATLVCIFEAILCRRTLLQLKRDPITHLLNIFYWLPVTYPHETKSSLALKEVLLPYGISCCHFYPNPGSTTKNSTKRPGHTNFLHIRPLRGNKLL